MKKIALLSFAFAANFGVPAAFAAENFLEKENENLVAYPKNFAAEAENFLGENRVAWRNERVIFRVAVEDVPENAKIFAEFLPKKKSSGTTNFPKIEARAEFVRATLGNDKKAVLDAVEAQNSNFKIPRGNALFLVSVDIPEGVVPENYEVFLNVNSKKNRLGNVEILSQKLPFPRDWKIHLDLWQHPEAVARWAGTPLWSDAHFAAMKPIFSRLAEAGQKAITCSIVDEPWEHQTFDDWSSMISWKKTAAGTWKFDYSAFDKFVEFMSNEIGISEQISCYTMVSWSQKTKIFNEATGTTETISIKVDDPNCEEIWAAFLQDFRAHLREKNWLEKTCIALDERPDKFLRAAKNLVQKYAPELKIVSAVNFPAAPAGTPEDAAVYDLSPIFNHAETKIPRERKRAADTAGTPLKTTFYVCLWPKNPNTFPHSKAAEPHWLLLFAAANNFDGFLRWAYNSWPKNPFENAVWEKKNWPAGDTFLVYPGNRTTLRFETLRDGIEDFEKIRILRECASAKASGTTEFKTAVENLEKFLAENFTISNGLNSENDFSEQVLKARNLIDAASKLVPAAVPEN